MTSTPTLTGPRYGPRERRERRGRCGRQWRAVRGHWLFTLIFTAGLAGRVLAEVAYRPALLYIDSVKYLGSTDDSEPQGYRLLQRLLDPLGGLGVVTAVQHVFGLAMAAAGYTLLVRRRVPRWLAALAVAPVLLDAYQFQLEQTIMPDVLFETMITVGLVLLLWRRRPGQAGHERARAGVRARGGRRGLRPPQAAPGRTRRVSLARSDARAGRRGRADE